MSVSLLYAWERSTQLYLFERPVVGMGSGSCIILFVSLKYCIGKKDADLPGRCIAGKDADFVYKPSLKAREDI